VNVKQTPADALHAESVWASVVNPAPPPPPSPPSLPSPFHPILRGAGPQPVGSSKRQTGNSWIWVSSLSSHSSISRSPRLENLSLIVRERRPQTPRQVLAVEVNECVGVAVAVLDFVVVLFYLLCHGPRVISSHPSFHLSDFIIVGSFFEDYRRLRDNVDIDCERRQPQQ